MAKGLQKSDAKYWNGFLPVISVADIKQCPRNELKTLEPGSCRVMLINIGSMVLHQICFAVKGSVSY